MAFPFRLRTCLCLLLFTFSLVRLSWSTEPQWMEVRSAHFSVYTDASERRGRETALQFEKMRSVFGVLLGNAQSVPDTPEIVAFRSAEEMRQVAPLWNGKPTEVAGFFQESDERSYVVVDLSAEEPWRVVLHEYGHQLLTRGLPRKVDPWFAEGFAGYFSTIESYSKETRIGTIRDRDFETLQKDGMFKVADLLRIKQSSKTYSESGDRRSVFYAESTLLVHYLYDNSLLPAAFKYFELLEQEMPVEAAIQQAFGMSPEQLDKALRNYVDAGRFRTYVVPIQEGASHDQFTVRALSTAEAAFVTADIHLHSADYQQRGLQELQKIVESAPGDEVALRELGATYLEQKKYSEARDCLRRAALSDPKDARAHYYSALLMSRERGFSNVADLPAMKKELEASLALDPKSADAQSLLAFVETFSGQADAGLESMKKAVALRPADVTHRFNLAQLYLHNRMADPAIALLTAIDSTGNEFLNKRIAESMKDALAMKVSRAGGNVSVPGFLMLTP
jgi:tetratricopeptide (TPR) repeat protein